MNNDTTALQERLWDAIFEARDLPGKTGQASTMSIVEAILPIIAAEVQAAKAEALRKIAPHLNDSGDESFLLAAATEYEEDRP